MFFSKQHIRQQQPLAILLTSILLQLVLTALDAEPARAASSRPDSEPAQSVQLEQIQMLSQETGWALERARTRVFFTSTGPSHWTNETPGGLNLPANDSANALTTASFLDAHHGYLGALQDGATSLLRTRDGGKTWTSTPFDFSPFTGIDISQIQFLDARHGWLVFDKEHGFGKYEIILMSTNDGGETWQQLLDTTQGSLSGLPSEQPKIFSFTSAQHGWVVGPEDNADNARLYETNDGGKTWTRYPLPALPGAIASVSYGPYFSNVHDGTLAVKYYSEQGTNYLVTYHTHDGGKTWAVNPVLQSDVASAWNMLAFHKSGHGWALGLDGNDQPTLSRTSDGGRQWQVIHPIGLQPFVGAILDLSFISSTEGLLISEDEDGTRTLFHTSDAGEHWRTLHPHLHR